MTESAARALYPIVHLDALTVKMRNEGRVETRAVYTAIGINREGQKSVLGLWVSASEGAKFWLGVRTSLKNRGLKDVLILCTDGLKGFSGAIKAVYPQALVQTCLVHLLRVSLNNASWKDGASRTVVSGLPPAAAQAPSSGRCLGTELGA